MSQITHVIVSYSPLPLPAAATTTAGAQKERLLTRVARVAFSSLAPALALAPGA